MNPNFSEELQKIYHDVFLHQGATFEALAAAFTFAAMQPQASTSNPSPSTSHPFSLEIPREEIECDIEILMLNNLRASLKKKDTTMNGLHGKKYGFREMVDLACSGPAYPASRLESKRSRTTSVGSFNSSMLQSTSSSPLSSTKGEENIPKKIKLGDDTAESLDESNASSYDVEGKSQIDWAEPAAEVEETMKVEKPEEIDDADGDEEDFRKHKYDPVKLCIQRIKNIERKKLKINLDGHIPVYNANMARSSFLTGHGTVAEQLRREKNTTAARVSRLKSRRCEMILKEQAMQATMENISKKRHIACLRVYANSLLKLNKIDEINFSQMWESHIKHLCPSD